MFYRNPPEGDYWILWYNVMLPDDWQLIEVNILAHLKKSMSGNT
jgi:hypothetical protein